MKLNESIEVPKLLSNLLNPSSRVLKSWKHRFNNSRTMVKKSKNNHKPPTDEFYKPKPKSLLQKNNRRLDGQPGHVGHTLERVKNPNHIVVHSVTDCFSCRSNRPRSIWTSYQENSCISYSLSVPTV